MRSDATSPSFNAQLASELGWPFLEPLLLLVPAKPGLLPPPGSLPFLFDIRLPFLRMFAILGSPNSSSSSSTPNWSSSSPQALSDSGRKLEYVRREGGDLVLFVPGGGVPRFDVEDVGGVRGLGSPDMALEAHQQSSTGRSGGSRTGC